MQQQLPLSKKIPNKQIDVVSNISDIQRSVSPLYTPEEKFSSREVSFT